MRLRSTTLRTWLWIICGSLVLAYSLGSTILSFQFEYGHGHADRPIVTFLLFYFIGWLGYLGGTILVGQGESGKRSFIGIIGIALLSRLVFLPSNLIQENDCYRYVLDGTCVLNRINPYAYSPEEHKHNATLPTNVEAYSAKAQILLSRIGYPEIPTIYPPFAQIVFAIGAYLTPWHWMGQRVVFLVFDLATLLVILLLLSHLQKSLGFSLLYAWNPLVLKEIANSAHLDSLVGFCIVTLIFALHRFRDSQKLSSCVIAALAFSGAVLAKIYPLIMLPICCVYVYKIKNGLRYVTLFLVLSFFIIFLAYIPFINVGIDQITKGLRTYGTDWVNNEGAFSLCTFFARNFKHLDHLPLDRIFSNVLTGIVALICSVSMIKKGDQFESFLWFLQITLISWFLLLPAVFPWYAIGIIVITALHPKKLVVFMSGLFGLYYLLFYIDYQEHPPQWRMLVQLVEHGPIWVWILISYFLRITKKRIPNI